MKLELVIIAAGLTGAGWLFLKAREMDRGTKLKGASGSIRKAARKASGDIGEPPIRKHVVLRSNTPARFSVSEATKVVLGKQR